MERYISRRLKELLALLPLTVLFAIILWLAGGCGGAVEPQAERQQDDEQGTATSESFCEPGWRLAINDSNSCCPVSFPYASYHECHRTQGEADTANTTERLTSECAGILTREELVLSLDAIFAERMEGVTYSDQITAAQNACDFEIQCMSCLFAITDAVYAL